MLPPLISVTSSAGCCHPIPRPSFISAVPVGLGESFGDCLQRPHLSTICFRRIVRITTKESSLTTRGRQISPVTPPASVSASAIPSRPIVQPVAQEEQKATSRPKSLWSPETHPLLLYNTLSRDKQLFKTHEPGLVRFYSCGPTVYDYAHVGNFRAFLTYDVVKRWLLYRGYRVSHVMNLTDVDDKIIRRAREQKCEASEITKKFARLFFADLNLLNVIPADKYPLATQHIPDIEDIINLLRRRGHAYQRDGSTYFRVSSFAAYGQLAELDKREAPNSFPNIGELTDGAADADADEYDKDDVRDFALWKAYKEEDGAVYWNNSLGKGRPGWHIECSCMAMKYLGPKLDIHGGGIDLVFPHHDNEKAQSEAATGEPFSTFWIHNGFVNIDNEKMSKSLGNFRTLRDVVKRPDDARAFRYLVVSSQYRSALAFTAQCMKSARSTVKRLDTVRTKLEQLVASDANGNDGTEVNEDIQTAIEKAHEQFCVAMDDDLNSPRAAAAMFTLVKFTEKALKSQRLRSPDAQAVLDCLLNMDSVFGIFYTPKLEGADKPKGPSSGGEDEVQITSEFQQLLAERAEARKAKDFARADEIRDQFTAAGFAIVDTKEGAKLRRLES